MHAIMTIAKRELNSYFDSLIAYIIIVAFLGFSGFFTWLYGADIFIRKEADLQVFFGVAKWTLFFFIPAITMRQLAEEKKTGTIELLLTKNVTDRQVITGKFLACFFMVLIALAFTIPYYITVANIGNIDHGATICGYFGLMLMSAAYVAIGIFASSITNNQIVAFLLALFIGIFFQFLFDVMASNATGWIGETLANLSLSRHFDSVTRGLLDTKDLVYFGSLIFMGIMLSELAIRNRN